MKLKLSGCAMSVNATFGIVYVKMNELEKHVIMLLNIAVEITGTLEKQRFSAIRIAHRATVISTTMLGMN